MPHLTDLVDVIPPDKEDEPEDIFASAPGLIFTDEIQNLHGDPDATIVYKSARFGPIELKTADPTGEEERRLFGHYLWNAGIKLAELISGQKGSSWKVEGEQVLELGAGVGLGGIVATLAGAQEVTISDYPSPAVLSNIQRNARSNIPTTLESVYSIRGHEWGDITTEFARSHRHHFTRIVAADCYWMPSQHAALVRSLLHFLTLEPGGRVFAVAGFHTGRAKLAEFLELAEDEGLVGEEIYEEDAMGRRREWARERDGGTEDHGERKKWLVIARLMRRRV